jgi:hypothetical protein
MDATLDRLNELCLALPEAEVEYANTHAGYSVKGKRFAWYLQNHHGDGITALSVRQPPGVNQSLVEMAPDRYYLPAYMAHHGWVALRLDLGEVHWSEVATLVLDSYRLQAPKRLLAQLT